MNTFKKIIMILLLILPLFIAGCKPKSGGTNTGDNEDDPKENIKEVERISFDESLISEKMSTNFDITKYNITVYYNDSTTEEVPITTNMLSDNKYNDYGSHELTITYLGFSCKISYEICRFFDVLFMVNDELYKTIEVFQGGSLTEFPEVPYVEGKIGHWDKHSIKNVEGNVTVNAYYVDEENLNMSEVISRLNNYMDGMVVDGDVDLPLFIDHASITWQSENDDVIDNEGILNRSYDPQYVTLNATITLDGETENKSYTVYVKGYKSLSEGIASGYIYSCYNNVNDNYFKTMDIIFCAFVEVDVDGNFTGLDATGTDISQSVKTALAKIKYYLQPEAKKRGIYLVPSLGGGGSAAARTFATIAASDKLRKAFAKNVVDLINEYGFDGIDIDWETPSSSKKGDFTLMMKELYTAVKANNPHHIVTAAIGGGKWSPPRYDLPNSIAYLDYVNVMTYNMTTSGGYYQNALKAAGSNLDPTNGVGKTMDSCSIEESITIYNNLNVPNSKLLFGLAFYGITQSKSGTRWSSGTSTSYDVIKRLKDTGDYTYCYDTRCEVPYLIKNDGTIFISYDDPRGVIAKAEYMLTHGCAGLTYWENGNDSTGDLVEAMRIGLNKGE